MRDYDKENKIIDDKLKSELKPFLDGLEGIDVDSRAHGLYRAAYLDFKERHERTSEIRSYAMQGLFSKTHAVKDSIQLMFSYLGLVESLGTALVDILIILLVANGIDFHVERSSRFPRIKHALMMKDLEDEYTPLKTKLNFLKENGIVTLPAIIDTETRNSIAHMNFEVKGNQVLTKGKPIEEKLLESERKLLHASNTITNLLGKSISKKAT
jgi:hypothetical protein